MSYSTRRGFLLATAAPPVNLAMERTMHGTTIEELASEFGTSAQLVKSLLAGGIPERHVQDVLEIRDSNAFAYTAKDRRGSNVEREELISAERLIALYKMVDGDLDFMITAIEVAIEDAAQRVGRNDFPPRGIYAAAIDRLLHRGVSALRVY